MSIDAFFRYAVAERAVLSARRVLSRRREVSIDAGMVARLALQYVERRGVDGVSERDLYDIAASQLRAAYGGGAR